MSFTKFFRKFKKSVPEPEPFQFFEKLPVNLAEQLLPYLPYIDAQNLGDTCTVLRQFVDKNEDRLQRRTYCLEIKQTDDTIEFVYYNWNRHREKWEPFKVEQSIEEPIKIVRVDSFQNDIIQRIKLINLRMEGIYYLCDIISDKLFEIIQQNAADVYIYVENFDVSSFCNIDNLKFMRSTYLIKEGQLRMLLSNNPSIDLIEVCCNVTSVALIANHYKEHNTLTYRTSIPLEEYGDPEAVHSLFESYFHPYSVSYGEDPTEETEKVHKQTDNEINANQSRTSVFSRFFGCFKWH